MPRTYITPMWPASIWFDFYCSFVTWASSHLHDLHLSDLTFIAPMLFDLRCIYMIWSLLYSSYLILLHLHDLIVIVCLTWPHAAPMWLDLHCLISPHTYCMYVIVLHCTYGTWPYCTYLPWRTLLLRDLQLLDFDFHYTYLIWLTLLLTDLRLSNWRSYCTCLTWPSLILRDLHLADLTLIAPTCLKQLTKDNVIVIKLYTKPLPHECHFTWSPWSCAVHSSHQPRGCHSLCL